VANTPERHPLVYILVLNWNGKDDTLECLRSLSEITYPNTRVVVIDNASIDGSVTAIRGQYPSVHVIENTTNLRFAGGNNVGIRYAVEQGAELVLLLNNDTTVDKHFVSELVLPFVSDKTIGIGGAKIYYSSQPDRLWYAGGRIEWWKGWISHRGIREIDNGQHDRSGETDYITGCCLLVRREVVERIGVLDNRYTMYGEDVDWCVRARKAGYSLWYVPSAKIWHKVSVSSGGHFSWFKNWNKLRSIFRLMHTHGSWYHWITFPPMLAVNIVLSFFSARRR